MLAGSAGRRSRSLGGTTVKRFRPPPAALAGWSAGALARTRRRLQQDQMGSNVALYGMVNYHILFYQAAFAGGIHFKEVL